MKNICIPFILLTMFAHLPARDFTYKTVLLRAAPGKLLPLIDLLKADIHKHAGYGLEKPYLLRHSQGDQWDLLLLIPVGSLETYYKNENAAKRNGSFAFDHTFGDRFYDFIAFHEEMFVHGPPLAELRQRFDASGYFHVEMFIALPGKQMELLRQRQMENVYLKAIGREQNLIFTRVGGAKWDLFTVGCYRDLKHFARSADIPAEVEEKAALQAGFKGANFIGSYLRELIDEHHDTLAVKVSDK